MNRRDFLKLGGAVSVAVLFKLPGQPTHVEAKGMQYRGTADGKIYKSSDRKNWELLTDFGPGYSVARVDADLHGQVFARLRCSGRAIELNLLKDGKTWWLN